MGVGLEIQSRLVSSKGHVLVYKQCFAWPVRLVIVLLLGIGLPAVGQQAHDAPAPPPPERVLRAYVERADDSFSWKVRQRGRIGPCDVVELTLASQTWRELLWQHRLFLLVPANVPADTDAVLVIAGGSWKPRDADPVPAAAGADLGNAFPKEALLMSAYAQQMGCPIAVLLNVPRQPIFDGRKEDAIIALTFDQYLRTGEADWPLLLPMVKSAVRAMDAVQAFAAKELKLRIDGFTVTGASKRGWTTWLTAAVDGRVRGLAPMVIDMLNIEAQFRHMMESYGRLSERIHDYTDRDLPRRMSGDAGAALRQIVDPYSYRNQITQPKLLILGTNDGFWTVDALNLYWDELAGEKYITYVPNADHDLANDWRRIMSALRALHRHAHGQEKLPPIEWSYVDDADDGRNVTLELQSGDAAAKAFLWTADSPTRDFREAKWTSAALPLDAAGDGRVTLDPPARGYRACFAEVMYGSGLMPLHLSTTIRVLPAGKR